MVGAAENGSSGKLSCVAQISYDNRRRRNAAGVSTIRLPVVDEHDAGGNLPGETLMAENESQMSDPSQHRRMALSRWDYEGGAGPRGPQEGADLQDGQSQELPLTNAELVQLRIRVIALENLLIALLADASDQQLNRIRDMAAFIVPRPGFTRHPLTIHAAAEMVSLVERSGHFRSTSRTSAGEPEANTPNEHAATVRGL